MCYNQCAICTMLRAPCKKCCAIRTSLLLLRYLYANFSATWFNSREFMLFWREFPNVAKYAFFVLIFWAEIFIRAILLRFCISDIGVHDQTMRFFTRSELASTKVISLLLETETTFVWNWNKLLLKRIEKNYLPTPLSFISRQRIQFPSGICKKRRIFFKAAPQSTTINRINHN